eukprot:TRINITY_DN7658_c1_g1_i1.p1 TRINITY_DN7658_c1_g1~~TRINITY_DN7658_c1_g1_i1.p1  ORF type:complete len:454 (-),score=21.36 TRINITY_DN7658_c1_g1_i1:296-1657(-)
MIVLYVFVWQMGKHGVHLKALPISGVYESKVISPAQNDCNMADPRCQYNLRKSGELPYCAQSLQPYIGTKRPCEHETSLLASNDERSSGIDIYTRLREYTSRKLCPRNSSDDCAQKRIWNYSIVSDSYYADVESFNILLHHSFTTKEPDISGSLRFRQGYIRSCPKNTRDCNVKLIPNMEIQHPLYDFASDSSLAKAHGAKQPSSLLQPARSVFLSNKAARRKLFNPHVLAASRSAVDDHISTPWSTLEQHSLARKAVTTPTSRLPQPVSDHIGGYDAWPVKDLLRAAGVDLDDDKASGTNSTLRDVGVHLLLTITYSNSKLDASGKRHFSTWPSLSIEKQLADVAYTYCVQSIPTPNIVEETNHMPDGTWMLNEYSGIRVKVEVRGELLLWDWPVFFVFVGATVGLVHIADNFINHYVNFVYEEDIKTQYTTDPSTGRLIEEPRQVPRGGAS